jgi:N-acetylglucosaminyl-diphospho-decaprenol L-rhamnosyltransferase
LIPDVSVLLVTYRCRDEAAACLRSIHETTERENVEIVLLDNASGDGTVELVRSDFPDVRLIASPENLGFALGVNRAAEQATGEFVLLLNPDMEVHPGAIESLVAFARAHPQHGLYGGRTLDPDGTVNPGSCWGAPSLWSLFCFAALLSTTFKHSRLFDPESLGGWQRDTVREVDIVTGCLLLARRTLWEELGGFDTRFFMYGEDADLSFRAKALGYRPAITPDAVVTHEIGVSSATREDKLILLFQGKATLLRKHWRGLRLRLGLLLLQAGVGLRALLAVLGRRTDPRAAAWRQVWRERKSWLAGYPEPAHEGPSPAAAPPHGVGAA